MHSDGVPSVVEILHELIEALIKAEQWEEAVRVCDRCVDKHCKPSGTNMLGREVLNGLFTLTETDSGTDSDLDSKPSGYIVLCRTCSHCTDSDLDPYSLFLQDWNLSPSPYPIRSPTM